MVENVLSMSDEVYSLGENRIFSKLLHKLKENKDQNENQISKILIDFREYYFSIIKFRTQKSIIINKSLNNYEYVGLINKIFPEAKFINLNRNPVNQLFSCFKINFSSKEGLNYTHNQHSLIQVYHAYKKMINYWSEQNIKNLISFNYEDLANDKQKYFYDLFQFLNLDYKQEYLEIENNRNVSKTASLLQVRKKIDISESNFKIVYQSKIKTLLNEFNDFSD